ncbi:hypothetical protein [Leptolyngbya sp. Heron Island J]|uniref:hypothetical protein n=1 Tax=Leptolyngbya sp. Heron Island J TaxID=1385935 RepID=UPI0004CDDF2F|nr:hypothetical protein [Leptolyngbya sp. Heron Island J]
MANPLTNVSLQTSLVNEGQALAQELNLSWGQLVSMALQEFIRRHRRPANLVEQLNAFYGDTLEEDARLLTQMRSTHRRLVDGEW